MKIKVTLRLGKDLEPFFEKVVDLEVEERELNNILIDDFAEHNGPSKSTEFELDMLSIDVRDMNVLTDWEILKNGD